MDTTSGPRARGSPSAILIDGSRRTLRAEFRDQAEGAEGPLYCRRVEAISDENQTRPPVLVGPCAQVSRGMDEMLNRMHGHRRGRVRDIEDALDPQQLVAMARSEERRVGKECRSRWSP